MVVNEYPHSTSLMSINYLEYLYEQYQKALKYRDCDIQGISV